MTGFVDVERTRSERRKEVIELVRDMWWEGECRRKEETEQRLVFVQKK